MARLNRTRFAILGMLSTGPRSGYDLKRDFERRMSHFWAESVGQIYPTLKRLHNEDLVEEISRQGAGRRARTLYAITQKGRERLKDWLREPPQREQVRNEILLKLYFGPEMGVDIALDHLAGFEASQRGLLELLQGFEQELVEAAETAEQELFWKITLSSGLHKVRARIAWCEETRHELALWRRSQDKANPKSPQERETT